MKTKHKQFPFRTKSKRGSKSPQLDFLSFRQKRKKVRTSLLLAFSTALCFVWQCKSQLTLELGSSEDRLIIALFPVLKMVSYISMHGRQIIIANAGHFSQKNFEGTNLAKCFLDSLNIKTAFVLADAKLFISRIFGSRPMVLIRPFKQRWDKSDGKLHTPQYSHNYYIDALLYV